MNPRCLEAPFNCYVAESGVESKSVRSVPFALQSLIECETSNCFSSRQQKFPIRNFVVMALSLLAYSNANAFLSIIRSLVYYDLLLYRPVWVC